MYVSTMWPAALFHVWMYRTALPRTAALDLVVVEHDPRLRGVENKLRWDELLGTEVSVRDGALAGSLPAFADIVKLDLDLVTRI